MCWSRIFIVPFFARGSPDRWVHQQTVLLLERAAAIWPQAPPTQSHYLMHFTFAQIIKERGGGKKKKKEGSLRRGHFPPQRCVFPFVAAVS